MYLKISPDFIWTKKSKQKRTYKEYISKFPVKIKAMIINLKQNKNSVISSKCSLLMRLKKTLLFEASIF